MSLSRIFAFFAMKIWSQYHIKWSLLNNESQKTFNNKKKIQWSLSKFIHLNKFLLFNIFPNLNEKFLIGDDLKMGLANPLPGTLIHEGMGNENNEFFLVG